MDAVNASTAIARRLEGRVALVTGAGSGMGRASAVRFAREGAAVVVSDIDADAAEAVAAAMAADGGSATAIACDTGDLAQIEEMIGRVGERFGVLHVLFNHAGVLGGAGVDVDLDDYTRVVNVNERGPFFTTKLALPLLEEARGKASVIFTSSVSGVSGSPFSPLYSMTKGGVVLLAKSLAKQLGPSGIRCNAILPGMIDTPTFWASLTRDGDADLDATRRRFLDSVRCGGSPARSRWRRWPRSSPATTPSGSRGWPCPSTAGCSRDSLCAWKTRESESCCGRGATIRATRSGSLWGGRVPWIDEHAAKGGRSMTVGVVQ